MKNEFYYIYSRGILGVKTNIDNFKWIYGSTAPNASVEEYKTCLVKFDISIKPEKDLHHVDTFDKKFQSYMWNSKTKTITCRRSFLHNFKIGFDIRIEGNTICAEIGRNYYKYVQGRTMNLHGIYYLISDLANIILLKNGFLSLYASAVYNEKINKGSVIFAPPNTGKTLTATKLCNIPSYRLVGEDIVITDIKTIYSCPWTSSYRKNTTHMDNSGALGRVRKNIIVDNIHDKCDLTDIVVLALGEKSINANKKEVLEQICILNGYLFGYYSSPIVKILAYFDVEYRNPWGEISMSMFKEMVDNSSCQIIQAENPIEFFDLVGI